MARHCRTTVLRSQHHEAPAAGQLACIALRRWLLSFLPLSLASMRLRHCREQPARLLAHFDHVAGILHLLTSRSRSSPRRRRRRAHPATRGRHYSQGYARARAHANPPRARARAYTGEKVHKPNRILHALLKKSCKSGGMSFKNLRRIYSTTHTHTSDTSLTSAHHPADR